MGNLLETSTGSGSRPGFGGLTGNKLGFAISFVSTTGFLLFGYDQGTFVHNVPKSGERDAN